MNDDDLFLSTRQRQVELTRLAADALGRAARLGAGKPEDDRPRFFRSQLRDPKFFEDHRDEIFEALRDGRVIDDLGGGLTRSAAFEAARRLAREKGDR
jgi:hypothetical protein